MSEIQRYMYARDGMVPDAEHLRGSGEPEFWVRFTDHEAERAENLATIDFLNKELRSAVDALADAEARIEGLVHKEQGFDNADMEYGYGRGLAESIRALAALTQPQTANDSLIDTKDHGGGAATAAGVADADLDLSIRAEAFKSYIDLTEDEEMVLDDAVDAYQTALSWEEPGPYAKAFRERFPVPEFPGIEKEEAA